MPTAQIILFPLSLFLDTKVPCQLLPKPSVIPAYSPERKFMTAHHTFLFSADSHGALLYIGKGTASKSLCPYGTFENKGKG